MSAYALMWSGGKDSALALARCQRRAVEVRWLVTVYDDVTARVRFHATPIASIARQAAAANVDHIAVPTSWTDFDAALGATLDDLVSRGCTGLVFGDIHLTDVRAWYERRSRAAGLEHVEPLWGEQPLDLLREFVDIGGRAVLTCVDENALDTRWLGRVIDERFIEDIVATGVDPCGENGEYHSFAFAGPFFARPVPWTLGERRNDGRFAQVDLI